MTRLFLTAEEASWVFNTSDQTIRNRAREGRLSKADFERPFRVTMESVVRVSGLSAETICAYIDAEAARRKKAKQEQRLLAAA